MDVIIKPVITEKMTDLGEKLGHVGFIVDKRANKVEIRKAIESAYGVTVTSINTAVYPGKRKSRNTKGGVIHGSTGAYKKAIVQLAEGDNIDFYSNI